VKAHTLKKALKIAEKTLVSEKKAMVEYFTKFCFFGDRVLTVNNYTAIEVHLAETVPVDLGQVDGLKLLRFVNSLGEEDEIEFSFEGGLVNILAGSSTLTLENQPSSDFPLSTLRVEEDCWKSRVSPEMLKELRHLGMSFTPNPFNAHSTGVCFVRDRLLATDGQTITAVINDVLDLPEVQEGIFVPVPAVSILTAIHVWVDFDFQFEIQREKNSFNFVFLNGESPEVTFKVLTPHSLNDRKELVQQITDVHDKNKNSLLHDPIPITEEMVDAVSRLTSTEANYVTFTFNKEGVVLESSNKKSRIKEDLKVEGVEELNRRVFTVPLHRLKKAVKSANSLCFSLGSIVINYDNKEHWIAVTT